MSNVLLKTPDKMLATVNGIYSLHRVKAYNRFVGHKLRCPPAVYPAFERPISGASTTRTPMKRYGWDDAMYFLNGDRIRIATQKGLAMYNGVDTWEEGNDKQESLFMACSWVYAKPSDTWGWHEIWTMNYEAGPPSSLLQYKDNPVLTMKFTMMCWKAGALLGRMLYYPVVTRDPCFLPSKYLEPWSENMETPDPPMGTNVFNATDPLFEIMAYDRKYYDYRDWEVDVVE